MTPTQAQSGTLLSAVSKPTIAKLAAASSLQPDLKVLEDKAKDGAKPASKPAAQ